MKLKFKQQDFQTDAVNAVCALFDGQQRRTSTFYIEHWQLELFADIGVSNTISLDDKRMIENMQAVQQKNLLPQTDDLQGRQFSIEMETGTGKTYVYTKTIYELNRLYGFTKFIVVVPSVAIREGVYKSLQTTQEHFSALYDNAPCHYFIYNSSKLSGVRQFATSANIEIMIINIDAFRKAENIINQQQDKLNGDTAISYIRAARPIVIIDEPQSVDNTQKAKDAIASLAPLCVFRYSATHREKINLLYRLTPVDAYQMGLVKQICVSSNQAMGGFNKSYIKLLSVSNEDGFRARVEIDVAGKNGKVSRKALTVKPGADLCKLSGGRDLYEGYVVSGIDCTPGMEQIELSNTNVVRLGKAIGDIDENVVKRMQIRRTIEAHLDKELRYTQKGIKVLSLFFIDEVKKYRGAKGCKGIYAQMFEELYAELIALPKYAELRRRFPAEAERVHDGYFSQDKKGNYKDTKGDTLDDASTYNTIMRDKEWLLSFDCPLRFIFSHSALKEGWDNPNVFQVCTLIEQKNVLTARQKVGRGLRLCVNQEGERIEDRNINLLHVMANESFAEFADNLQKEIEEETGVRFGVLQLSLFSGIAFKETKIEETPLTKAQAATLLSHLAEEGFIKSGDMPAPEDGRSAPLQENEFALSLSEDKLAAPLPEDKLVAPLPQDELVAPLPLELRAAKAKAIEVIAREGGITPPSHGAANGAENRRRTARADLRRRPAAYGPF
ncbi:MAG: DEAD/DEAH box helicase family protein [Clostridium sp.]|nr:DEAD/DEAH box helicase family protein [Clostridium sp.]